MLWCNVIVIFRVPIMFGVDDIGRRSGDLADENFRCGVCLRVSVTPCGVAGLAVGNNIVLTKNVDENTCWGDICFYL